MDIQSELTNVAKKAAIGAAAGTLVGPLGTAGGAAAGAVGALAGRAVGKLYQSQIAENENMYNVAGVSSLALATLAGSVYAAGALLNTPVTLLGAAAHTAGYLGVLFTAEKAKESVHDTVKELAQNIEIENRKETLRLIEEAEGQFNL